MKLCQGVIYARTVLLVVFVGLSASVQGELFTGGAGTPDDPYQISTAEHLLSIGSEPNLLDKCFVLVADIDLDPNLPGGQVFTQALIGDAWESEFTGCFDGAGHLIRNMVIQAPGELRVGLFGVIDQAEIKNIGVVNAHVEAQASAGGLVGRSSNSVIRSSYATGYFRADSTVGGLVGRGSSDVILSCYAMGQVVGGNRVGGLLGSSHRGCIMMSYAVCRVTGEGYFVGGLIGGDYEHSVYLSYWDIEASHLNTSFGGVGKSTVLMRSAATFRGWGYDDQWVLDEGRDTPRLAWEGRPGQAIVEGEYAYGGGAGESNDPYQIGTANELTAIGWRPMDWGKCFVLSANIDMLASDANEIQPIGTWALPFSGVLDGQGHTINHFIYADAQRSYTGLFGYIGGMDDSVGVVRGLHLEGVEILGARFVGGLVGINAGTIISCSVSGRVAGENQIGGLVGYNLQDGAISGCAAGGLVTGDWSVGGLVGEHRGMHTLTSSFSTSDVTGGTFVGGLVGQSEPDSPISSCYATGSVSGEDYVGGLVGSSNGSIMFCYAVGHVSGDGHMGGLTGRTRDVVYHSYWDMESSGLDTSGGGRGKTTVQMKDLQTYRGWGYDHQWTLDEGQDYPHLLWEGQPGFPIQDETRFYGGGTGQPDDPYLIASAEDLVILGRFPDDWDKHFIMMADISLAALDPHEIIPIGTTAIPFTGMFDGAGHTIGRLRFPPTQENFLGLFGCIGVHVFDDSLTPGVVKDLHLNEVDILGRGTIGAIAGYNAGMIWACSVAGAIVGTSDEIGGLVGYNEGDISHSHMSGTVRGDDYIGGLVGRNRLGTITRSYALGSVTGDEVSGGLAGSNSGTIIQCYAAGNVFCTEDAGGLVSTNGGTILECYATGDVTGGEDSGGFVGRNSGSVTACYATGRVTGPEDVGGFAVSNRGDIIASFWDTETSGLTTSFGALGLTTAEMQTSTPFLAAAWDFTDIWTICEGKGYPQLSWEQISCDE